MKYCFQQHSEQLILLHKYDRNCIIDFYTDEEQDRNFALF